MFGLLIEMKSFINKISPTVLLLVYILDESICRISCIKNPSICRMALWFREEIKIMDIR
jgi:hypothetical protein